MLVFEVKFLGQGDFESLGKPIEKRRSALIRRLFDAEQGCGHILAGFHVLRQNRILLQHRFELGSRQTEFRLFLIVLRHAAIDAEENHRHHGAGDNREARGVPVIFVN